MASHRRAHAGTVLSPAVLLAWTSAAWAQPAGAFADLARRLHLGDTVRIQDLGGVSHAGTVVDLSPDAIVIDSAGDRHRFTGADTLRVVRRGDSLVNGALFAFIPGYLLGVQLNEVVSDHYEPAGAGVRNGLITGTIGAAIGLAVDALRQGEREIYAAAPRTFAVVPALLRHGASTSVVLTW